MNLLKTSLLAATMVMSQPVLSAPPSDRPHHGQQGKYEQYQDNNDFRYYQREKMQHYRNDRMVHECIERAQNKRDIGLCVKDHQDERKAYRDRYKDEYKNRKSYRDDHDEYRKQRHEEMQNLSPKEREAKRQEYREKYREEYKDKYRDKYRHDDDDRPYRRDGNGPHRMMRDDD